MISKKKQQKPNQNCKVQEKDKTLTHGLQFPTKKLPQGKLNHLPFLHNFFRLPLSLIWNTTYKRNQMGPNILLSNLHTLI